MAIWRWLEHPAWFVLFVAVGIRQVVTRQDWFGVAMGWFLVVWGIFRLILFVWDRLLQRRRGCHR